MNVIYDATKDLKKDLDELHQKWDKERKLHDEELNKRLEERASQMKKNKK